MRKEISKFSLNQYDENGFAVVENFLSNNETDELSEAGLDLYEEAPNNQRISYQNHSISSLEQYIFDSADQINYFYDYDASNSDESSLTDRTMSLNRLGHGLHLRNSTFKKYTFDDRVKNVARKIGFRKPVILQSVFVYKNTKCKQHRDLSHLLDDPVKVTTFWISTEDATIENGCVWFAKGSHKNGGYVRDFDETEEMTTNENDLNFIELNLPREQFTSVPVKRGSLVILDGSTIHFSDSNFTNENRYTYTFRIMETDYANYEPQNWFRLPGVERVSRLY